jgi:hypothetical protein
LSDREHRDEAIIGMEMWAAEVARQPFVDDNIKARLFGIAN